MQASDLLTHQQDAPLTYRAIQILFRVVLRTFYNRIVLENEDNLPKSGPTILCANHSNSLTDPTLLISQISSRQRKMLRMTAKDSHFRQGTLSSWLIENAGTIPIMRAKDHPDMNNAQIQELNKKTFSKLITALEAGDCVCLFPEGISRFHPSPATLKTGVARIASTLLSSHAADPSFELKIATCSITYLHRQRFRSSVLATFNAPILLTPATHLVLTQGKEAAIRALTAEIEARLKSGCLSARTWKVLKLAHTARRLYAPAGPEEMALGDFVRLTQCFVDMLDQSEERNKGLMLDLEEYQNSLAKLGLKDHRVYVHSELSNLVLLQRFGLRLIWSAVLCTLASPGLLLWLPTLLFTKRQERKFKKKGPRWDVYDEIAQTKLVYGLVSVVLTYLAVNILFFPFILVTSWAVPVLFWLSLRWYEDLVSALRSMISLWTLIKLNIFHPAELAALRKRREELRVAVVRLAISNGLPGEYAEWLHCGEKRKKPALRRRLSYFSLQRRRIKDWNEALYLWDVQQEDESGSEGEESK